MSRQSGSVTGKSAPQLQSQAAGSILSSGLSVRSQCHKTTLYKRHEIIRLPTRLAAGWQAKQPAESGRKRKAALCLPGSSRQALHRQGLGVQHFGLPDHKELYHDDGLHRLVSCSFRFHFRVRGPLKYGGVRTGELPDSCSGLTTAWPGQLRQLDITVL